MKIIFAIVAVALIAIVVSAADSSGPSNEYLPPYINDQDFGRVAAGFGPPRQYLPANQGNQGNQGEEPAPAHSLGADGYRYKNPTRF